MKTTSLPGLPPEVIAENSRKLSAQLRRAMRASSTEHKMSCVECGTEAKLYALYRCFECGCWYCQSCAGPHFGMVRPINRSTPS